MWLDHLKLNSIKTRVTLYTLTLFVVGILLIALNASHKLEREITQQITKQQQSSNAMLAQEISDHLNQRIVTLENMGDKISQIGLEKTDDLQNFLNDRFVIKRDYNAGVFITNSRGNIIASVSKSIPRGQNNYLEKDSIELAFEQNASNISNLFVDHYSHDYAFFITAPIREKNGNPIGTITGMTSLKLPSFLDKIRNSHYGTSGYYLLKDRNSTMIITCSDKRRIFKMQPATDKESLAARHLQGYEESGIVTNPDGVKVLITAKRVPLTKWMLISALPAQEAFAPIKAMQLQIMLGALLLSIGIGAATWWLLWRELHPVFSTIKALSSLSESAVKAELPLIKNKGEISELIHSFDHLLKALQQRENALTESEFRWKFAIEGAGDGLWDWDIKNGRVFYSPKWKKQLGYESEDIGQSIKEWEQRIHPEDKAHTFAAVQDHLEGKTPSYSVEHRLLTKNGSYKWILTRGLVVSRDNEGNPLRAIGTHADIDERRKLEENIRHQAMYDPLTQLPNRRLLEDHLSRMLAASKRYGNYGALMFIDLDNFKPLNDTHGHEMGDLLLMEVARRLRGCVRETDTVARIGGDEFVVAISELYLDMPTSRKQAKLLAEKIRSALEQPYLLDNPNQNGTISTIEHHCTASIGLTLFQGDEQSISDITRSADYAMYQAKNAGRNQVHFVAPIQKKT